MDFSKYPFEKLFYFVAGIIPGFVALLIFERAAPGSFGWFFSMGFLGYRTKLALVLLVAFLVGNSMTTFLSGLLGSVGGIVGAITALRPYTPPHSYEVAPWRDPKWRTALKHYLGPEAPKDTRPFFQELLTLMQKEVDYLPEQERPGALAKLRNDKLNAEIDDGRWEQWYDHYQLANSLAGRGLLRRQANNVSLTVSGWERLEEIRRAGRSSSLVFVAMWFDTSTITLYEEGIKPAVREAGYEPLRIDQHETVNRIDDEIIGQMRRSRFMVADFTGQRHGVYFEAGFMMGLLRG
jgi:hypothetical protein